MKHSFLLIAAFFCLSLTSNAQISWNTELKSTWTSPVATEYNDIWGYVDPQGREYAIIGSRQGTHFVNVTDPTNPIEVGYEPGAAVSLIWRDFTVVDQYAYGVADVGQHSLQIFDLQYLPDSVVKVYDDPTISTAAHNVQAFGDRIYLIDNKDAQGNRNSVVVVDVSNPLVPTVIGGITDQSYNLGHDVYIRNDTVFLSVYNAGSFNGLHVWDMVDAANPQLIGSYQNYPEAGINHASWGSEDKTTLILADETHGSGLKLVDITDISAMTTLSVFRSNAGAIAHNPFIIDDTMAVISYYHDGLQFFDITDRTEPVQVGYYDTEPTLPTSPGNYQGFEGNWGVYPFFPSGNMIASDMANGLFVITYSPGATVGLKDGIANDGVRLYPNPAKDNVVIRLDETINEALEVKVYNSNGALVKSSWISGRHENTDFDVSDLAKGVYHIRLQGLSFNDSQKLIIE